MSSENIQPQANGLGEKIEEIAECNDTITNNDIAEQLNTQVSIVRDIRDNRVNNDTDPQQPTTTTEPSRNGSQSTTSQPPSTESSRESHTEALGRTTLTLQRQDYSQSLSNSGEHLLDLLEDPVVKLKHLDGDCVIHGVNKEFINVFGYSERELIGTSLSEKITPESPESETHDCLPTDQQSTDHVTVSRMTTSGVRHFVRRGIPDMQGSNEYIYRIFTDVTDYERREESLTEQVERLQEQNKELQEKSKQLEQFSSILSHDLRNPINIAEGYLQQVKTDANEENVEVIERALSRVNNLIDDTLTLKNQSEPVRDDEYELVSIHSVAESAWELVETGDSELQIVDSFSIACDADRLQRLFENAFRNAIEHNETPVTLRVGVHDTLTTSTRGNTTNAFHISDDGTGIPDEKRGELREIGKTTTREGTGLGLAIIDRTAKAHGWGMQLTDSFDNGLKIVFTNVDIDR